MSLSSHDIAPISEPAQPREVTISGGLWCPLSKIEANETGIKGAYYGNEEPFSDPTNEKPYFQFRKYIYRLGLDGSVQIDMQLRRYEGAGELVDFDLFSNLNDGIIRDHANITNDVEGSTVLTFTETPLPTPVVSAMTKNR